MTNHLTSPEAESNSSDWQIEPAAPDNGEMFDMTAFYSVPEFTRILRVLINRNLSDATAAPIVQVMEHWEKRVLEYVASLEEGADEVVVGFETGADKITRIYFAFETNIR